MPALAVRRPGMGTVVYTLQAPVTTLGRDAGADIRILSPFVSRWHARVATGPGGAWLEDCGSKNGVLAGGQQIPSRFGLSHGTEFLIGDCVLTFLSDDDDSSTLTLDLAPAIPVFDSATRRVTFPGRDPVALSRQEFALFEALWEVVGRVASHDAIGRSVWGTHAAGGRELPAYSPNMIHRLVHRLRRKLEAAALDCVRIRAVEGAGYQMDLEPPCAGAAEADSARAVSP